MPAGDRKPRLERRIARGLRRRDPRAFDLLYADYHSTVLGYLVNTLPDRASAEDVCQLVFLEVWNRGSDYDPQRGGLLTWVMTIARSRAIDHLRKRVPEPADPAGAEGTDPPDDEMTNRVADRWLVAHLLRRLPEDRAAMLRMRFHEGLSQSEIADRIEIPIGTVKWKMSDAMERLRQMLDAEGARP